MNLPQTSAKSSPSSWWYAVCVLVFLVPASVGGTVFVRKLLHLTDHLVQVVVPGSADLKFDRPGLNTVFLEEQSVVDGRVYATNDSVSGLTCKVRAQDGSLLNLHRTSVSTTYQLSGRSGKSALEFNVPGPGTYHFECGYGEGQTGPQVVLAVGSGVGTDIFVSIGALFAGLGSGFLVAAVVAVVIYQKQRRNRPKTIQYSANFPAPSA